MPREQRVCYCNLCNPQRTPKLIWTCLFKLSSINSFPAFEGYTKQTDFSSTWESPAYLKPFFPCRRAHIWNTWGEWRCVSDRFDFNWIRLCFEGHIPATPRRPHMCLAHCPINTNISEGRVRREWKWREEPRKKTASFPRTLTLLPSQGSLFPVSK